MRIERLEMCMAIAKVVAQRGTCDRARVGCVIVDKHGRPVSWGYNGSPAGEPHCDDVGHLMYGDSCIRTVHAEQNAVFYISRTGGPRVEGATIYCTHFPCLNCAKMIVTAGIETLVYERDYRPLDSAPAYQVFAAARTRIYQYNGDYHALKNLG